MPAKNLGDVTDKCHVLVTELAANGALIAQTGDVVSGEVRDSNCEFWFPPGYASRPSKPDAGTAAAESIAITAGDHNALIGHRDLRMSEIYGNLSDGEVCLFAGGDDALGQAKLILKDDGSVVMHTTDNNTHDGLGCYVKFSPDEFRVQYPFGSIVFNAQGLFIVHDSGASFSMGAVANPAQPNYVRFATSAFYADSPQINLYPSTVNGGKGVALAPVLAPIASAQTGVPTPIGAGMGVILGVTGQGVFIGA